MSGDDHGHHHHHHHGHGHGLHQSASAPGLQLDGGVDEEEGALLILEARRKYRAAKKGLKKTYEELEDTVFDSRRPPLLRTAGGEVVQGTYPPRSHKWLGVQPRFGSTVPAQKYVGAFANDLSKWISTDKVVRLKQEASIFDQPVRAYVRIDDSIDVAQMTGSHIKFFDNPLDEELQAQKAKKKQLALMGNEMHALEDEHSEATSITTSNRDTSTEDDQSDEEWDPDDEYEYETESSDQDQESEGSDQTHYTDEQKAMKRKERDAKTLTILDRIFDKHCKKLGAGMREEMDERLRQVEGDWRAGQATRPATLRFRR